VPTRAARREGEAGPEPRPGDACAGLCPLCASSSLRLQAFRYAFRGRHLYGATCSSCALTFVHPQPAAAEIESFYRQDYYTECSAECGAHGPRAYMDLARDSTAEVARRARQVDRLLLRHQPARGRFLEVGCGPGFLLRDMARLGWDVSGLEISEFAARYAREQLGLRVEVGPLEAPTLPQHSLDAVFMGDVLEHLPQPLSALAAVHAWLSPGGILCVAVPSTLNLLSAQLGLALFRVRGRFKTLRIPPYHLFEYTPRTLAALLSACGFEVVALRQSAVPPGRMGLRHSPVENLAKATLQVGAQISARLCNRWGDRLLAVAVRRAH